MIGRSLSLVLVGFGMLLLVGSAPPPLAGRSSLPNAEPAPLQNPALNESGTDVDPEPGECCRVCHKGKACGNSCISPKLACHKPPGCACDG
jgi:hypothetical protein